MTTNYEQSKAYAENGQYARAQTFALLAIADRLEDVGGALIHLIPMPDVQGPFSDDSNEDKVGHWFTTPRRTLLGTMPNGSFDWPEHIINALGEGDGDNDEYAFHDEEFCDGPEDLIEEISAVVEAVKFYRQQAKAQADAALEREKAARDEIIVHRMEAAYLRAGLEKLLESFLTLTGIQRRHVQSVLNHTWTPA